MKNITINNSSLLHIAYSVLLLSSCSNAMEITSRPIKKNFIQPNITQHTQSSFIIFPREINDTIIRTLCNIPTHVPVTITIEDAIRYYHSIKKLCPLTVGNRIYIVDDLILLTQRQKQELIRLANPNNFNRKMGFSHALISKKDEQTLDTMPDHIRQDLNIEVFDPKPDPESFVGLILPWGIGFTGSLIFLGETLQKSTTILGLLPKLGIVGAFIGGGICCCCAFHNPTCAEYIGTKSVIKDTYKYKKEY